MVNDKQILHYLFYYIQEWHFYIFQFLQVFFYMDKIFLHLDISLFPIKNRRISIKKIEDHLGIQLNLLRAPHWITVTLSLLFLISLFGLAFHWKIALIGFTLSFVGIFLASKFGTVLDLQTVGQLTSKMACEHYLKCRRNPQTFNKAEIQPILTDLFSNELALHKYKLTRQTQFS